MKCLTLSRLSILALFISSTIFAQAPGISWQKSLGGSNPDYSSAIQKIAGGGYIVAGASFSNDGDVTGNHGNADFWVVKLDSVGTIVWQKSLGGSNDDIAQSVQQTTDGGYIVGGYSKSNDGDVTGHHGTSSSFDIWVVKLDSVGTLVWQKSLGGTSDDYAYSIQQTTDGGYIVVGGTNSTDGDITVNHGGNDIWVVKLTATGTITWQKSLGGSADDYGSSIQQTADGGYIVGGYSNSTDGDVTGVHGGLGYNDYWVVKLDSSGTLVWQKSLGGTYDDYSTGIQQTTDGGYIVVGGSTSNDGDVTGHHGPANTAYDFWVVKLDSVGTIVWQKSLGGTDYDVSSGVQQTTDGGYIVAGDSVSNDGDVTGHHGVGSYDIWIVRLNSTGDIWWQESLGGTAVDWAELVQQTTDSGYIVAGTSYSTDGDVTGNHGSNDFWIVKLEKGATSKVEDVSGNIKISTYPNPTSDYIYVDGIDISKIESMKIFDILGQQVENAEISIDSNKTNRTKINVGQLANGVYMIQIVTPSGAITKKFNKV